MFLKISKNSQKKDMWFAKFSRTPFLQNTSGRLLLFFPCNFTKMRHCQQCLENLRWKLFIYKHWPWKYHSGISFPSRQHKPSVYVFIGLHSLLPEAATRVEVFCKRGVLKKFVNFIGKQLYWSLFLISCRPDTYFEEYLPTTAFALYSVLLYIQHLLSRHHCYYC